MSEWKRLPECRIEQEKRVEDYEGEAQRDLRKRIAATEHRANRHNRRASGEGKHIIRNKQGTDTFYCEICEKVMTTTTRQSFFFDECPGPG